MYLEGKKNILKTSWEGFTKTLQRHTALNLEHSNVLISISVEKSLPDIKMQIQGNRVEWVGQPSNIIRMQPNF